jgi:hypothetical protein
MDPEEFNAGGGGLEATEKLMFLYLLLSKKL